MRGNINQHVPCPLQHCAHGGNVHKLPSAREFKFIWLYEKALVHNKVRFTSLHCPLAVTECNHMPGIFFYIFALKPQQNQGSLVDNLHLYGSLDPELKKILRGKTLKRKPIHTRQRGPGAKQKFETMNRRTRNATAQHSCHLQSLSQTLRKPSLAKLPGIEQTLL